MNLSYTKEQRAEAAKTGQPLATIAVAGIGYSGVVTPNEQQEIVTFWLAFMTRRAERLKGDSVKPAGGA